MNEGQRLRRKEARVPHLVVDDAVEHLLLVLAGERRLEERRGGGGGVRERTDSTQAKGTPRVANNLSYQHLKDEDPHPPPVHRSGVVVVRQDLGSQKLWSAAEGGGPVSVTHPCRKGARRVIARRPGRRSE